MPTDWTIGEGLLSNGFPDSDWTSRVTMLATPTDAGWRVWLRWGTTWGHTAVSEAPTFDQALEQAGRNAARDDCPDEWNPRVPKRRATSAEHTDHGTYSTQDRKRLDSLQDK